VIAISALAVVNNPWTKPEELIGRRLNEVFVGVLDCPEGDPRFGPRVGLARQYIIRDIMEEFAARKGLLVTAEPILKEDIDEPPGDFPDADL
jgi:hypothetical protein